VVDRKAHLLQLCADGAVKDDHLATVDSLGERFVVRHSVPPITRQEAGRARAHFVADVLHFVDFVRIRDCATHRAQCCAKPSYASKPSL
jgi:hypothetical protein